MTTFDEYAQGWIETREALDTLGASGVDVYNYTRKTLAPLLTGHISGVTKRDAEAALVALKRRGLSSTTVRLIHGRAKAIFASAMQDGVASANPFATAERPKAKAPKTQTIHAPELRAFLEAVRGDLYGAVIRFAVLTGCRRGEIAGLKWGDIDYATRTIRIQQSRTVTRSGGCRVKSPKTKSSTRRIAIPQVLVDEIRSLPRDGQFVFGDRHPNRLTQGVKERLRQHGLGSFTLHDLRHAHATLLLRAKENPKAVARRLGHADVGTTLRIYGHVMDEDDAGLSDAAGRMLA
jgi:integrase